MNMMYILSVILVIAHTILARQVQYTKETTKEVCIEEELDIRCKYNEVIAMTSALYGHLHQSRCIPRDFGHFGCQAEVLSFLDGRCSGKRSCDLDMIDRELTQHKPQCSLGLLVFLEYKYICVQGQPITDLCKILPVEQTASYFQSLSAAKADCLRRDDQAFVSMAVTEGQRIEIIITYFHFQNSTDLVNQKFALQENGYEIQLEFQQNREGDMEASYISTAPRITLILKDFDHNALVSYQARGCSDFTIPTNTWTKKGNNSVTVGCYNSDQTWTLSCVGTKWIGTIGNCTARTVELPKVVPSVAPEESESYVNEVQHDAYLSKELWIVIISATTAFACGVVFLIGCICVKLAKRKSVINKNYKRCEMIPLDANLRHIRNGDVKNENIRAWQQTLTSQDNNRSLARNNNGQLIVMDQDLITINGI